jgi:hypothetical protein
MQEGHGKHISSPERKHCQPSLVYLAKLSFLIEREIKTFYSKQMLKEFIIIKPEL